MLLTTRLFVAAALLCGASWLTKTAAIAATGGTQTDGGVVGIFWALGMLGLLVAAGTGTAALLHSRPPWVRALAGVASAPVAFVLVNLVDGAAKTAYAGDGWFRDEVGLIVSGTLVAALALVVLARGRQMGPELS